MSATIAPVRRRHALAALAAAALVAACGGGGDAGDAGPAAGPAGGTVESRIVASRAVGTSYYVDVYLPPASAGPRAAMPVVYVLDGESWGYAFAQIVGTSGTPAIVVSIQTGGQRNRDYAPSNACTPGGGGQGAYLSFLRDELVPFVESTYGGSPSRRILFGHSHGGSLVLYALFAEAAGAHTFAAYLPVDASVGCSETESRRWNDAYAERQSTLPVRLHLSYATAGNFAQNVDYAARIAQKGYGALAFRSQAYTGSHNGVVPQAFGDAYGFAVASGS